MAEKSGRKSPALAPAKKKKKRQRDDELSEAPAKKKGKKDVELPAEAKADAPAKKTKKTGESTAKAEAEVVDSQVPAKRKAKKTGDSAADEEVTLQAELEKQRREHQKAVQQAVIALQKQGIAKKEIDAAKNKLKRQFEKEKVKLLRKHGAFSKKNGDAEEEVAELPVKTEAMKAKEHREELQVKHEVVVIPIAYRRHTDRAKKVEVVCENVKQALMTRGIDCWVDQRRQYTPGQRFAYWEHLGICYRIEVGEVEADKGTCNVVHTKTPGAYLEHDRAKGVPLNTGAILVKLRDFGFAPKHKKAKQQFGSLGDEAELVHNEDLRFAEEKPGAAKSKKSPLAAPSTADALGEDFWKL